MDKLLIIFPSGEKFSIAAVDIAELEMRKLFPPDSDDYHLAVVAMTNDLDRLLQSMRCLGWDVLRHYCISLPSQRSDADLETTFSYADIVPMEK